MSCESCGLPATYDPKRYPGGSFCENPQCGAYQDIPAYIPVPVAAAREIAENCGKDLVVIWSFDKQHRAAHVTTYATDQDDKRTAAELGEVIAHVLEMDMKWKTVFEDLPKP